MKTTTFKLNMSDSHPLSIMSWQPEKRPVKGAIQIVHGMAEYIGRYSDFAQFLTDNGYAVYGDDHRGHGLSITNEDMGHLEPGGFEQMVHDEWEVTRHIKKEQPQVPVILFAHSMGSFIARRYIQLYGDEIDKAVICATRGPDWLMNEIGLAICQFRKKTVGHKHVDKILNQLFFGSNNQKCRPQRTEFDWLSGNTDIVDQYVKNPLCGFIPTTSFFYELLNGIQMINLKKNICQTPTDLPLFFIFGDRDPVGNYGKGVKQAMKLYLKCGTTQLEYKCYPGARHELLNEINNQEVYQDVLNWIEKKIEPRMNTD